jgi:hypothetical protein
MRAGRRRDAAGSDRAGRAVWLASRACMANRRAVSPASLEFSFIYLFCLDFRKING